ncbi:MAG: hypothetical protein RSG59_06905 [Ruthenibacterium sp.]
MWIEKNTTAAHTRFEKLHQKIRLLQRLSVVAASGSFLNAGQNAVRFDPAQAPLALPPRKIQEAIIQSSFHRGRTNTSRTAAVPAFAAPSRIALRQKITERRHKEPGDHRKYQ